MPPNVAFQNGSDAAISSLIVLAMPPVTLLALSCMLSFGPSTQAQSTDQALNDFRTQILKQHLFLQNFSADAVTNFEWTSNGLAGAPPKVRTLGVFTIGSTKLHNDRLELNGSRSTIGRDQAGKSVFSREEPVVINIVFRGADPANILPVLKQQLFFPTLTSAIAAMPLQYRQMLSLPDQPSTSLPPPLPLECPVAGAHFVRPKVLHQEEPDFTDEARLAHFSGSVTILFTVDENGHATDLWLAKPAGLGLDQNAVKALSGYTFKPATCDGTT